MVTMNLLNHNTASSLLQPDEHRHLMQPPHQQHATRHHRRIRSVIALLLAGILALIAAILSAQFSWLEAVLDVRARMSPLLPSTSMWLQPEPIVRMSIRIFTVRNVDAFLAGRAERMQLQEIGPIVYREHLRHDDVQRHPENSTMSYTAVRWLEYLDAENEPGILNRTITVPNFALLSAASMFADASLFTKIAFKTLKMSTGDTAFINITVYDYLWNYRSKLVSSAKMLVPFMVPVENAGILAIIYQNLIDRYNVRIGDAFPGPQFFSINRINGRTTVPGHPTAAGSCDASVVNSTEGAVYGQRLRPHADQIYWRKTLCRPVPLRYVGETRVGVLDAFEYRLANDTYDRGANLSADCYKGPARGAPLPDGLSDLSQCLFDMPLAASNPHFFGREANFGHKFEGLRPRADEHVSWAIVEPSLGMPLRQCAKSQSNLVIPNLSGLTSDLARFSDMVLPLFWLQYHLRDLTTEITLLVVAIVRVVPVLQVICTAALFVASAVCLLLASQRYTNSPRLKFGRRLSRTLEGCAEGVGGVCGTAQRRLSMVLVKANESMVRHMVQLDTGGRGDADEKSSMCRK